MIAAIAQVFVAAGAPDRRATLGQLTEVTFRPCCTA
jgi:hypothetical protein